MINREEERRFNTKTSLFLFLFSLILFAVILKVLYMQTFSKEEFIEEVRRKFANVSTIKIPVYRGSIKSIEGRDLAISVPTISVYVHPSPKFLNNKETFLKRLSEISGVPYRTLSRKLKENRPTVLIRGLNPDKEREVRKLIKETKNSRFVGIQEEYTRIYPFKTLASNLLGFVGVDGIGLEGMEYALNGYLGGGYTRAIVYSHVYLGSIFPEPLKGKLGKESDVFLTIDLGVQKILEDIRDKIVERWKPKKVSIILIEAHTGRILGLTNYPYYDPNRFYKYPAEKRRNYAVTDIFEPGSIMKPIFVAYALEKGIVDTNFKVDTGKGRIKVYDRYIRDTRPLGVIDLEEILIYSSNVGIVKVASLFKREDVEEMLEMFHLNERFKVFPGEANPQIPDLKYPANILYMSIGQGIGLNTLNIAVAFAGLATGNIVKPQIIEKVVNLEGKETYRIRREVLRKNILSERTRLWIRRALINVVEKGTGVRAKSRYFYIAGKTGTSQKFDPETGRYSREKVITYFAGFFPATNPAFVGVIVVDEPKGKKLYGGIVSAPYFKELVERVSFYYGLKPDKLKQ